MVTTKVIEQLPSLTHLLVQILDALQSGADTVELAELIRQDAIVSGKLLAAANASHPPCHTIEQALDILTDNQLQTLLVSHGIRQFFNPEPGPTQQQLQIELWQSALACAHFSRVLATLTSYHSPEEAYLCGLFANLGQSALLEEYGDSYSELLQNSSNPGHQVELELQNFGQQHSELAANTVEGWHLSDFIADAIRYQHEPLEQVRDAHHLVKIIHCSKLAADIDQLQQQLIDDAQQLFGLHPDLTSELYTRNVNDIDKMADNLQLAKQDSFLETRSQLGRLLGELSELSQISSGLFLASGSRSHLLEAIDQCLLLNFGISRSVLFLFDEAAQQLSTLAENPVKDADFRLQVEPGRSLAADCLRENQALESNRKQSLTVIDRQLLHYCQGDTLCCWPLRHRERDVGVLVFASNSQQHDELRSRSSLLSKLCRQMAHCLASQPDGLQSQPGESIPQSSAYQLKIREAVHEASNPLSIINNYLEMLRIKLGDEHEAGDSLGLIKEEIKRVGNILNKLREQPEPEQEHLPTLNVNRVVENTAKIIRESICVAKNIALQLHLDEQMPDIQGDSNHLKQILTNLLKNSAEALHADGQITIYSDPHTSFNGRDCVSIRVLDNGPGLPEEITARLFYPVNSSKGKNHSGLGLSIVKKLVDEMNGYILCRSNKTSGTEFQILLPKIH